MRRMPGRAERISAKGHQGVSRGSNPRRGGTDKLASQHENQDNGRTVDHQQTKVYSRATLPEQRHQYRISSSSAGELNAVGQLPWWNALQQQLARVCILAFISLERHVAQTEADPCSQQEN